MSRMTKSQPNSVVLDGNGGFKYKEQPYRQGIMYKNGDLTHFIENSEKWSKLRMKIVERLELLTDELSLEELYHDLIAENVIPEDFNIQKLRIWIDTYTQFKVITAENGNLLLVKNLDDSNPRES